MTPTPRHTRDQTSERRAGSGRATPSSTTGSMTVTETANGQSIPLDVTQGTIRLRAERAEPSEGRRIQWAEDVVDNEGMGKKSSKVCCIYHKPKGKGESSDEESSDSSSSSDESDSEPDLSRAQPKRRDRAHNHLLNHDDYGPDCGDHSGPGKGKGKARKPSPNAYERVPKRKDPKT
ncbi:hypothetical protein MBLNU457_g0471t1 [Dothideomycetes sp. NU457]